MYPQSQTVTITTGAATGAGTGYTAPIHGRILSIRYIKDSYTGTPSLDVTLETSEAEVLSVVSMASSASWRPRSLVQKDTDGTNLSTYEPTYCGGERVKLAVASAGNSKTGTFIVVFG